VFNVPIVLSQRRVGAPFGDALLAGVASGALSDFRIAKEWFQGVEPMEPDQRNHDVYMEYFGLFKQLYEHVKDDFAVLGRLRG
jgi:sugar (pentulose or hexulose) kinase